MKGEEVEYAIPLRAVFLQPKTKRLRKALNEIRAFTFKHTRINNVAITSDLNSFLNKNSRNIPRKIDAVLRKDGERILVYLKGSKQLEEDKKEKEEAKKEKEKEEKKGVEKGKEVEEEKERKKEEKKEKERAAERSAMKRKIRE